MASIDLTLMAVLLPLGFGFLVGMFSNSLYVGGGGAAVILGWLAVKTGDTFILGAWFLLLVMMALATGQKFVRAMMGETA